MINNQQSDLKNREDNFRLIKREKLHHIDDLTLEATKTLYAWWASFAPNMPTRDDFDISLVPTIAGNIYLIKCESPGYYDYRLCGETVGDLIGRHYREHLFSVESSTFEDRTLAEYLDTITGDRCAYTCSGDLRFIDRQFIRFESVDCPLVNEEGMITHFLGAFAEVS